MYNSDCSTPLRFRWGDSDKPDGRLRRGDPRLLRRCLARTALSLLTRLASLYTDSSSRNGEGLLPAVNGVAPQDWRLW